MTNAHGILLALDDTPASTRAVEYIGDVLGGRSGARVVLAHVLRPVPTGLLEHGGSSDARAETRLEAELEEAQRAWIARAASEEAEPLFERSRDLLRARGVASDAIETRFADSIPEDRIGDLLVRLARESGCDTVAVGRNALPWLREAFHRHVCLDLLKAADGIAVWVVG